MTALAREALAGLLNTAAASHAGLHLSRGLARWPNGGTDKGNAFQAHIDAVCRVPVPEIYRLAYERWRSQLLAATGSACSILRVEERLFIGLGAPSPLETSIGLSHSYGVPLIPGSAIKGCVRAYARDNGMPVDTMSLLFGAGNDDVDDGESGCVAFHDAWWVPDDVGPLVAEVVTVHHAEYYQSLGDVAATDFDAPVPNVQIAARGSFLFAVESASAQWSAYALHWLERALEQRGIGGKTAAGYGYFSIDRDANAGLTDRRARLVREALSPDDRDRDEIERLTPAKLAELLGKNRNATKAQKGERWAAWCELVRQVHGPAMADWRESTNKHEKRAWKTLYGDPESAD